MVIIRRRYSCKEQETKKRKITQDDEADYLMITCRKMAAKARNVCASNMFDDLSSNEKFVWEKKIECEEGFSSTRKKEREIEREKVKELMARERAELDEFYLKKIKARAELRLRAGRIKTIDILSLHLDEPCLVFEFLALNDMEDLRENIKVYLDLDRATPTRIRYWEALLVVCDWELAKARKKESLDRARLRGEISPAEFLDEQRGMCSSTEADVKDFLKGDSYSEIEVLQSEIESLMRSGSAIVMEHWEPILKHIRIYKAKAFLKEEWLNLEKDYRSITRQEVDAGFDGKNDQTETEGAEGTGSSSSPEILFGEETGDNFEMMTMGVMEEGDALSGNFDEGILRSPVYWPIAWPVAQQSSSPELLYGEETGDKFEMKTMGVMEKGDAPGNIDEETPQSPVYRPIAWPFAQQI
ncbi:hypothetical protein POM88_039884 [Heracleum sosnowskyi]|uniref:Splicing factor cactin central domain-containing protein n=1 Tax=Heracleum sosnowskyi TaxID=360622 RepID=A0AAD8M9R5_9APIA|nr:hypothetical protein POM88_039884 [Heracleum sosnowskyi]